MAHSNPEALSEPDLEALERLAAAHEEDAVKQALVAARERLHMEAAYLTTVTPELQRVIDLDGDTSRFGFGVGTELAIQDTYCARMLKGDLPNVIPDTSGEPAVQDLPATASMGSYVGVPITLGDGSVHGTLCCAGSEPREGLGDEELAFMHVLADIVSRNIDGSRASMEEVTQSRPGEDH